jgi:hypothetical protein
MKKPKPMKLYKDGMYYIDCEDMDLFTQSFFWSDKKGKFIDFEIEKIETRKTLHTWSFYGFFKPSLGEIYSQILNWKDAIGFTIEPDISKNKYALTEDQKHQIGIVTLWRKKEV